MRLELAALSFLPFLVLIALITCCVAVFGNATLDGASQVSLLVASAVSVLVGHFTKRLTWDGLEQEITNKVASCTPAIVILLLIGAIGGTWMVSGIVPTMIYYGMQIIRPEVFLVSSSLLCALVSLMIGSSWTTVATIGVALMGIGKAHGFDDGWIAGSIITGAYFGDKLSPLSDTTVLASSVSGTPLFTHIRYMLYTTVPTFCVSLSVFLVAGLAMNVSGHGNVVEFMEGLQRTFVISPWLLVVPVLIARRWPSMVVLFMAMMLAAGMGLLVQPTLIHQISGEEGGGLLSAYKGMMQVCYGSISIETGVPMLNHLVHTSGMAGMMPTIWLIICAQTFGGALTATGQLHDLMRIVLRFVRGTASLVASTVGTALFCNIALADQYLSIMLSTQMFRDTYQKRGCESRLLSRSCEDSATVTSVLVPWNTCGLTQSTVLGVATLTYLPYCFFNLLSPVTSIVVAATGWKIKRRSVLLSMLLFLVFHLSFSPAHAQSLTMVELNCENLFDARHDSLKQDHEFLPDAERHWTEKRYWRKLNNIAQELLSCTNAGIPDIIALCEIDSDSVTRDLCRRSLLRNAGYKWMTTDSPDLRGIDVALLYNPFAFAPIVSHPIRVTPCHGDMRPTRDILYASGRIMSGDTLHIFVVHAPSRFGGEHHSRRFRLCVAERLAASIDSVYALNGQARIIVAGDFNDFPDSPAMLLLQSHGLTNISAQATGLRGVKGTYRYQGDWNHLDHILASPAIAANADTVYIHAPRFLLETEERYGGYRPRRTYIGPRYNPGYSDHLPLVARFTIGE